MEKVTISFDPIEHKYKDNHGHLYTSVTQLIDKFKPKFDELYWAKYKAKERNIPVEQVLMEWEIIRNNSCERGTATHEFLEDSVNSIYNTKDVEFNKLIETNHSVSADYKFCIKKVEDMYSLPLRDKLPDIFYKLVAYVRDGWTLYAEKRVYNTKYKIAGTIDLLLVKGKDFIIIDWKTNKDILRFSSGYYKKEEKVIDGVKTKVKGNTWINTQQYLDFPLNNIMECKGMLYTLQLSLYAYLIELFGFNLKNLTLIHILNNNFNDVKSYRIEYLKNDVIRMLDFHYKTKIQPKQITNNTNKFKIE